MTVKELGDVRGEGSTWPGATRVLQVGVCVCVCLCTCVCAWVCVSVYASVCVCLCVCMRVCAYTRVFQHTCTMMHDTCIRLGGWCSTESHRLSHVGSSNSVCKDGPHKNVPQPHIGREG